MVASRDNFPLLEELLAEQQRLDTPAARFSVAQELGLPSHPEARHRELIPLSQPGPGEQYAFEVQLDSCTGCKACVAACHSLNGLDEHETWRDVGLLVGGSAAQPFLQTVTTACHHCADPGCLNGCPVLAYEKDPVTGIVRHLDDQCIGCQYCVLKCPYDVPKYNRRLGIVRKCDMCPSRLAAGEAPACVQGCPTHAIRIVTVKTEDSERDFLPGAPDPHYTLPTTRYVSPRPLPETLAAADAAELRPQPAHWPLVLMLTLLPAAVGFQFASVAGTATTPPLDWLAAACGLCGLGASVAHLGQPLRAWRIFLGWRRSWLSREAMLFGGWFGLTALSLVRPEWRAAAAGTGVAGLLCSAMIYIDTRRTFWRAPSTFLRLFGTLAVFALAPAAPCIAALALLGKLIGEARALTGPSASARLLRGPLGGLVRLRFGAGFAALVLLGLLPIWAALVALFASELMERLIFFRAVDAPKMPGLPSGSPVSTGIALPETSVTSESRPGQPASSEAPMGRRVTAPGA